MRFFERQCMSSPDGRPNAGRAVLRTVLDFVVALPVVGMEIFGATPTLSTVVRVEKVVHTMVLNGGLCRPTGGPGKHRIATTGIPYEVPPVRR